MSIACHGLLRAPPADGDPVLIVGAGIIGLAALAALKGLFPAARSRCWRATSTKRTAAAACGADHVVLDDPDRWPHWEQLSELTGPRVVGRKQHQMLMGGFPYVVEAVGAPQSVTEALRAVAHRGTVLLLGAAGISEVDLTPIWYKEAALVGSIDHTVDAGSAPGLAGGAGPPLGRPGPRRAGRGAAARRGRRDPRVRARGLPRGGRGGHRPHHVARHQGGVPALIRWAQVALAGGEGHAQGLGLTRRQTGQQTRLDAIHPGVAVAHHLRPVLGEADAQDAAVVGVGRAHNQSLALEVGHHFAAGLG